MAPRDPLDLAWVTYAWVIFLSGWGGLVGFYRKLKTGKARPFNIMELIGEIFTSAFVGVLTFLLCEWSDLNHLLTAALVGISGHMGSRAIALIEHWAQERYGSLFRSHNESDL